MADKTYELVSWPANEEYLKNPASFSERTFKHAANVKGVQAFVLFLLLVCTRHPKDT
jgi:hypothetical protein